jgi:3-oxoacyl-[acyl-carrier protein] reductase
LTGSKRRALVTGAGSGLTAGIARALASDFHAISLTYRRSYPATLVKELTACGVHAEATHIDFSGDVDAIEKILAALAAQRGPFDTLVHGVGAIDVRRFERFTMRDYDALFNANVRSAILAARAVLPAMREMRMGRIVLFGGNGSHVTAPHPGLTLYQASKSAVVAFAKTLALEEAQHGITVNAIEIGDIRDKERLRADALLLPAENPRGRPGSVEDVADVVRFLIAPERDFITGTVIGVNGGLTAADERNAHRS